MNLAEIGQIIQSGRKARGLTQQSLAEQAGVSRYTLVKLENGQATDIQFKILSAILSELNQQLTISDMPVSGLPILGEE